VTLFIGITQHLDREKWADDKGKLTKCDEVSAKRGSSSENGFFWACCAEDYNPATVTCSGSVRVVDEHGKEHTVARQFVHRRVLVNTAHVVVSDDKGHDTEFVQKALPVVQAWCKEKGLVFTENLIRSDGATSHFKSKFTLHYLTKYVAEFSLERACWCFGAPGHGKGPWDGLAGMLKSWLRRQIVDNELIMSSEADVFTSLKGHFGTAEYEAEAKREKKHITAYNIQWLDAFDRATAGSAVVDTIDAHGRGVRKLFSFWAVAESQLASRVFSCWCPACVMGKRTADGMQFEGCERAEQWQTQEIRMTSDLGIAAQRKACRDRALVICEKELEAGRYYAMETADELQPEGNPNPVRFYVCRLFSWDDGTLVKKHTGKRACPPGQYNRQQRSKGDPLVRVCYFPLDCSDPSGCLFLDSGSVSTANGLGLRRRLDVGSFRKQESPPQEVALRAREVALRGSTPRVVALRALFGAAPTAPRWMARWELQAGERGKIDSVIYSGL
jgi:hypothetical protein